MMLSKKQQKLWTIIVIIASLALIIFSFTPFLTSLSR